MPSSPLVRITEGLSFDDVLLKPKYSMVGHRDTDIKIEVSLRGLRGDFTFAHPLIPANMDTVTGTQMAIVHAETRGLVLLHRFQTVEEQIQQFQVINPGIGPKYYVGASIGVQEEDKDRFQRLRDAGVMIFCVDIAHADSRGAELMVQHLKDERTELIIAGNVATGTGAKHLWDAGAHVVKVGVGPGSLCTTRIETGCGVPQISALIDVVEMREEFDHFEHRGIISDGGIKNAGDCVKALALSDMVMIGNLFASTDEAPGELDATKCFKRYVGSSTHKTSHVEGVKAWVKCTGPYQNTFKRLIDGITSGCSYNGCHSVRALQYSPEFVKITAAGMAESYPHGVQIEPDPKGK